MGETRLTPDHRLTRQLPWRRDSDELSKADWSLPLGSRLCSQPEGSKFPSLGGRESGSICTGNTAATGSLA